MKLENNQNISCQFAEDLISYLYNEIGDSDKLYFEKHLAQCADCAEELSNFGALRSSIIEWRNEEFQPLTTPVIAAIPERKVYDLSPAPSASPLFARFRDFFTLSPSWMRASAAFAVLAIFVGLLFVTVNSFRAPEIVRMAEDTALKPVSLPVNDSVNQTANELVADNEKTFAPESPKPILTETTKNKPLKVRETTVSKPEAKQSGAKINTAKAAHETKNTAKPLMRENEQNLPSPTLMAEDEEDDSLRLSDIFAEIGTK